MSIDVDTDQVLAGLKDFQRATVEHAFDRLFDAPDSTRRFLVADEVGLGKTMVARGVVAKAIDRLNRDGVERIDIVYICSNGDIADQNVRKLDVTGTGSRPRETANAPCHTGARPTRSVPQPGRPDARHIVRAVRWCWPR